MEKQSVFKVADKKLKEWHHLAWIHNQNKKQIAEQIFSNYRTVHNAMVLGEASKKTEKLLDNYFKSLK